MANENNIFQYMKNKFSAKVEVIHQGQKKLSGFNQSSLSIYLVHKKSYNQNPPSANYSKRIFTLANYATHNV